MVDLRNPGLSSHKEEHLKGRGTRTGRTRGLQGRRTGQCQTLKNNLQVGERRECGGWGLGAGVGVGGQGLGAGQGCVGAERILQAALPPSQASREQVQAEKSGPSRTTYPAAPTETLPNAKLK